MICATVDWYYLWSFPQLGLECRGKLTEMGMAGAESSAPWSECSGWGVPDTFSVLIEGQDSGCSGASRCNGFRVWSPKTNPFPRHSPVELREQLRCLFLPFSIFSYTVVQTLSLPSGSADLLSKRVCASVCVCVCTWLCRRKFKKNGKDLCIQENLAIKFFNR